MRLTHARTFSEGRELTVVVYSKSSSPPYARKFLTPIVGYGLQRSRTNFTRIHIHTQKNVSISDDALRNHVNFTDLSATVAYSLEWYRFIGRILGKALYEGILVDVAFAGFFLAKVC